MDNPVCPFDKVEDANKNIVILADKPCPVCGDYANGYGKDGISRCIMGDYHEAEQDS